MLCCCGAVLCCAVLCCAVPKALLPEGNGRDLYPRVQVNGRAVCLSVRCVLVTSAKCVVAKCVVVQLGPVHSCTGPVLLCRRPCTVTQGLLGSLHCVCCAALLGAVHCTALHCLCHAAVHCVRYTAPTSNTLPQRPGAVGSGTPAMHRHTACGQWVVEKLQCTAILHVGSGQWKSCIVPPHRLGAAQWKKFQKPKNSNKFQKKIQKTQWKKCNAPPHYVRAVGSGTPILHRPTAWGGHWNSCFAPLHCVWALGGGIRAVFCVTACGQW